MIKTE